MLQSVSMSVYQDDTAMQRSITTAALLPPQPLPAKKRGKMNILRVITHFIVRGRSNRKKTTRAIQHNVTQSGKDVMLKNMLGAVHTLQQMENASALTKTTVHSDMPRREIRLPPPSPCDSEGWFSSDGMSHYASTEDLRALDNCIEESEGEDESEEENNGGAPYDIDLQAEMFIARFYEQMRLQSMNLREKKAV